jgi:hypothetical protein
MSVCFQLIEWLSSFIFHLSSSAYSLQPIAYNPVNDYIIAIREFSAFQVCSSRESSNRKSMGDGYLRMAAGRMSFFEIV